MHTGWKHAHKPRSQQLAGAPTTMHTYRAFFWGNVVELNSGTSSWKRGGGIISCVSSSFPFWQFQHIFFPETKPCIYASWKAYIWLSYWLNWTIVCADHNLNSKHGLSIQSYDRFAISFSFLPLTSQVYSQLYKAAASESGVQAKTVMCQFRLHANHDLQIISKVWHALYQSGPNWNVPHSLPLDCSELHTCTPGPQLKLFNRLSVAYKYHFYVGKK